jgi:prepilin-type N-terminal cleavage/methylation domain-containing protein
MSAAGVKYRGFTLVEVLVSVSILGIILGTLGTAFFQSVSTQRHIVDDGYATNEARKGLSWFAPDVRSAQHAAIDPDNNTLELSWTDEYDYGFGATPAPCHVSRYHFDAAENVLKRTYIEGPEDPDGATHVVARRVERVAFPTPTTTETPSNLVTIELEVQTGPNTTKTLSMTAKMMVKPKSANPCLATP